MYETNDEPYIEFTFVLVPSSWLLFKFINLIPTLAKIFTFIAVLYNDYRPDPRGTSADDKS